MTKVFTDRSSDGLNELFPRKICINLGQRPERWAQMQSRFQRHGIQGVRRFPAIDGQALIPPAGWSATSGAYGCLLSHLQVVREARAMGVPVCSSITHSRMQRDCDLDVPIASVRAV
jgi:hypothetical protein